MFWIVTVSEKETVRGGCTCDYTTCVGSSLKLVTGEKPKRNFAVAVTLFVLLAVSAFAQFEKGSLEAP